MNRRDRRAAGKQGRGTSGAGDELFALAQQHHQAGQLFEAEALYRQVLSRDRKHVGSLHCIGIIALQRSQPEAAIDAITQALAVNDRLPESHYNIAFAYQALGRLDEAVTHYQRAAGLKPDYAEAHTNLGNALMQLGRHEEAAACYEHVVKLRPTAEAHYNLANLLAQIGRSEEAIAHYRRALAFKPDFVGVHNNLASALIAQGQSDEALIHVQRALALDPDLPEPYINLGNMPLGQRKLGEALAQIEQVLCSDAKSPKAHVNLGNVYLDQGRLAEAARCFQRALQMQSELPEANNNLGIVFAAKGDYEDAIRHFESAVAQQPDFMEAHDNLVRALLASGQVGKGLGAARLALSVRETPTIKGLFVDCAKLLSPPPDFADFRGLLTRALDEPWGRGNELTGVAAQVVKRTPAIQNRIARALEAWPRRLAAHELFGADGIATLAEDSLLRSLLVSAPIADLDIERFLTSARFALLGLALETEATTNDAIADFWCWLAQQCFLNEYVFAETSEETEGAKVLCGRLSTNLAAGSAIPALWIAALASYVPLHSPRDSDLLLNGSWSDALAGVLTQQIREPCEEQKLRSGIAILTSVDDAVSRLVQRQYEENPYPRWTKAEPPRKRLLFDQYLRGKFPASDFQPLGKPEFDILIAGCGSGQQAIEIAQRFPSARVLAVDLSLASLAYASRKTAEAGLPNIEYGQADILKLGSLGQTFDVIESSGVLHHLADPLAGWRLLVSLLRPGGFMALGLYSEIARADVVAARAFISEHRYGATAEDIRRCRQDIVAQDGGRAFKSLCRSVDFFTTSACRDLLFHVQEHRLTIPQIAGFLAENGLTFIGFEVEPLAVQQYRESFPADRSLTDLTCWDTFERDHPHTFAGMYQFWGPRSAADNMRSFGLPSTTADGSAC